MIDACLACLAACENCATECIRMANSLHLRCIALCRDCADICALCTKFELRSSQFKEEIMKLCADVCRACAAECDKFDDEHCRACARACMKCAEECSTY